MKRIVGVRFREWNFIRHFDAGSLELKKGDYVVAESPEGLSVGKVVEGPLAIPCENPSIKTIERIATEEDLRKYERHREFERKAREYCLSRIAFHGLQMKLVDVELLFDESKIIFYFTADGRVDFRELLKDLVKELRMRIELRQIGVRNHAAMCGGLGLCGRPICCSQFLSKFSPVSLKMAKEQNMSLNPLKISGVCGRLMCCLQYEYEVYAFLKKGLPKVGKKIETKEGIGKVIRQNALERSIVVEFEDGRQLEIKYPPIEDYIAQIEEDSDSVEIDDEENVNLEKEEM